MNRLLVTLAAQWAHLWHPSVPVDTLVHLAWTESRFTLTARNGTCCGPWQIDYRFAHGLTCRQLMNPFVAAPRAAYLLSWARRHYPGREIAWYKGRL